MSKKIKLYKENREFFMDPQMALAEGVVAVSDEIDTELLFEAYSFGIFPWPHNEKDPLLWFCPPQRGVLVFSDLKVPRSLRKFGRQSTWSYTFNRAFTQVMQDCADSQRPGQLGTWITPQLLEVYKKFHQQGYAHSIECWEGSELIGGLYGVYVGGIFCGESMFFKRPNASKLCLLNLVDRLKDFDLTWMDIQMLTPHMEALGAKVIRRTTFLKWLEEAKRKAKPLML